MGIDRIHNQVKIAFCDGVVLQRVVETNPEHRSRKLSDYGSSTAFPPDCVPGLHDISTFTRQRIDSLSVANLKSNRAILSRIAQVTSHFRLPKDIGQ